MNKPSLGTKSVSESLKIAQIDDEHGKKLRLIAEHLAVSNRRAIQFCLAEVFSIQTMARPSRHFHFGTDPIKTVFIPFDPQQLSYCESLINQERTSFKGKCQQAIESIHGRVRKGLDLKACPSYRSYCSK